MSDTDRIDWLERNMPLSLFKWHESDYTGDLVQAGTSDNVGRTLRDAIDVGLKMDTTRVPVDYETQYRELVDALCSKSWMGRNRHGSVVKLAQRLRDSQSYIRALEGNPLPQRCMRQDGHDGPCNGFPRPCCETHAFGRLVEMSKVTYTTMDGEVHELDVAQVPSITAMRSHKWVGQRQGGNPAETESYEWVRYCAVCGMEDTCEDPLPPCPGNGGLSK